MTASFGASCEATGGTKSTIGGGGGVGMRASKSMSLVLGGAGVRMKAWKRMSSIVEEQATAWARVLRPSSLSVAG